MNIEPVRFTPQITQQLSVPKAIAQEEATIKDNFSSSPRSEIAVMPNISGLKASTMKEAAEISTEFKSGFVTDFVNAQQVDNKVMELAKKYPDLVDVVTRKDRTSGYDGRMMDLRGPSPLRYIRVGKKDENRDKKTGVLLQASPHAREVMQPMIMLETLQQLLENYNPDSKDPKVKEITDLMDSVDIYMVAVSNPDGLNYALYDDPDWRKTRSPQPGTLEVGVDCNRNYDYGWIRMKPSEETYSGPYPFSEPETRNSAEIVDEHPNIKFVSEYHSRGEEIRRPIGVKDPKDLENFRKFQSRMQDAISTVRGRKYDLIESNVVNGSSDDYFYFKKGIYAFVVEDGTEFKPHLEEALNVVAENTEGAKELLRIAKEYAG